jgi:glutaredoxin 3
MAASVTVYRTQQCPYCVAAKRLLGQRGVAFDEVFLDDEPEQMAALKERLNYRTVPMIFIGERFIGGYSDLKALDDRGELMPMVQAL